jgi:hypothetical protein
LRHRRVKDRESDEAVDRGHRFGLARMLLGDQEYVSDDDIAEWEKVELDPSRLPREEMARRESISDWLLILREAKNERGALKSFKECSLSLQDRRAGLIRPTGKP